MDMAKGLENKENSLTGIIDWNRINWKFLTRRKEKKKLQSASIIKS